jgi:hypothetical protein
MNDVALGYFVLGVIFYQIVKMLALGINQAVINRRSKKFLKLVSVTFPDRENITFISIDTSDKRSMDRLEKQLREQFDLPENSR